MIKKNFHNLLPIEYHLYKLNFLKMPIENAMLDKVLSKKGFW